MDMKYELTQYTIDRGQSTLYQIRALHDFGDVRSGEFGGYIESESNLSQSGNCWVHKNAIVRENAVVSDNAQIYDSEISGKAVVEGDVIVKNSQVYGYALIQNSALVDRGAVVCQHAVISDNAVVSGAHVYGEALIKDNASLIEDGAADRMGITVENHAVVCENAVISGGAVIYKNACIQGNAHLSPDSTTNCVPRIYDNAVVEGNADIQAGCMICGNAVVAGDVEIREPIKINGNANIQSNADYRAFDVPYSKIYYNPKIEPLNMSAFQCTDGSMKFSGFGKTLPIDKFMNHVMKKDPAHRAEYIQMCDDASAYFEEMKDLELSDADLAGITTDQMQM